MEGVVAEELRGEGGLGWKEQDLVVEEMKVFEEMEGSREAVNTDSGSLTCCLGWEQVGGRSFWSTCPPSTLAKCPGENYFLNFSEFFVTVPVASEHW